MRVDITINKNDAPGMAGFGAPAWGRDDQELSMHPPLPEDIEHVQHDMELHAHEHSHHMVHRRDPEHDCNGEVARIELQELPFESIKPLLEGKGYILAPRKKHHTHGFAASLLKQHITKHAMNSAILPEEGDRVPHSM